MKTKWMYLSISVSPWVGSFSLLLFFKTFFCSFLEREMPEWCLECQGRVCHKDIIALGERTSVAFPKSCVWMKSASVCWEADKKKEKKKSRYPILRFHFSPFEKCSYFSSPGWGRVVGVYGTDSIRRISDGHNLIFQVQMFVLRKKRRTWTLYEKEITLWTHAWPLFLTNDGRDAGRFSWVQSRALGAQACRSFDRVASVPWRVMEHFVELRAVMRRLRLANRTGGRGVSLTKYFWMVSSFSDRAADRSGDAKSIQKTHCHKLKSESYMVLSLSFFIVILVKKTTTKQSSWEEDSYTIKNMLY